MPNQLPSFEWVISTAWVVVFLTLIGLGIWNIVQHRTGRGVGNIVLAILIMIVPLVGSTFISVVVNKIVAQLAAAAQTKPPSPISISSLTLMSVGAILACFIQGGRSHGFTKFLWIASGVTLLCWWTIDWMGFLPTV